MVEPVKIEYLWVVALVLIRRENGVETIRQSISWQSDCTEEHAIGAAVKFALEECPSTGFSIYGQMASKIELTKPSITLT